MDFQYIDSDSYKLDYDWLLHISLRYRRYQYKGLDIFDWSKLRWTDSQNSQYIRVDRLEDFQDNLVHKSTQPDRWFLGIGY